MPATYGVYVVAPEVRIQQIQSQANQATSTYPFPHFQNSQRQLPVVRLPIEVPLYRMANYRTRAIQLAYIREKGKPQDFFSSGQENQSTQQVQHDILFGFAQKGIGDSIVPIMEVLKGDKQHEPILITSDGIVVNGNRRLSAMRELFSNEGIQNYSHVDCMVLPDFATNDDIRKIEVKLQMTPHTLLPYDWVCEGIAIRELSEMGMTKEQIVDLMRKKPIEIDNHILALTHAELYLTDWMNAPGDYSRVLDKEQMFTDIAKNLKSKEGEDLEASRHIAYILTENSGNLGTRVYDYKSSFGPDSIEVVGRLARRLNVELTALAPEPKDGQLDLDFDLDDEETNDISYAPIIEVLKEKDRSKDLSDDITDIFDTLKSERDDRAAGQHALRRIREANSRLMEVDLTIADRSTYQAIQQQLTSIKTRVQELTTQLERQSSTGAGSND